MHCGVMVTGYNQGDWERLLKEDYDRAPTVSDDSQKGQARPLNKGRHTKILTTGRRMVKHG